MISKSAIGDDQMNYDELNKFILNYIENDKTGRAIMLTGEWGSGKSYYIRHTLVPFLKIKENGGHKCAIVSLYGLNSISEISKVIYLELRTILKPITSEIHGQSFFHRIFRRLRTKLKPFTSESGNIIMLVSKTIINGLTDKIGLNISDINDKDLQKIYESINLTGKLIILEDFERTNIDIPNLLGYINNLCENDGVKVLIVANESKLINYEIQKKDGEEYKEYDEKSIEYLNEKEKTIGDTINFKCEEKRTISEIIKQFNNDNLNKFNNNDDIDYIFEMMRWYNSFNFRIFIFACQKTVDLFNKINKKDVKLYRTIFYSIISFSMKIKYNEIPEWIGTTYVSYELGFFEYPLYRFCYDYICLQKFSIGEVDLAIENHNKLVLYNERGSMNDTDLKIIYNFYIHTEQEVKEALSKVENRLADYQNIPFYDYAKLAYYLILLKKIIDYDYTSCRKKMIENLKGKYTEIDGDSLFVSINELDNAKEKEEYNNFISEMKESLNFNKSSDDFFSYKPDDLLNILNNINNKVIYTAHHIFISKFNTERLVKMLFICNSSQLQTFREIMGKVYNKASNSDFLEDDILAMETIKEKIEDHLKDNEDNMDKIVLYQFQLIIKNLERFIGNISK